MITNEQFGKWMKALRSGRYKQTKGTLKRLDDKGRVLGYCCLGVCAQVLKVDGYKDMGTKLEHDSGPSGIYDILVRDLGLNINNTGIGMNDIGKSFDEIADVLERLWKEGPNED